MLVWAKEIDGDFVRKLYEEANGSRRLVLCSPGGDVYSMGAALDLLGDGGWAIQATGACMSAAVPILLAGQHRVATERTRFMVHDPAIWWAESRTGPDELATEAAELAKLAEEYYELLANATKKTKAWWQKQVKDKGNFYFGSAEALKFGLISDIV